MIYDPSARDALEEQILSSLINYSYLFFNKKHPLKEEHFNGEIHRSIYKAIELSANKFGKVDLTTVTQTISDISSNGLTSKDIITILSNSSQYSSSEFESLCDQLFEYFTCDRVLDLANEIVTFKKKDADDFKTKIANWQSQFSSVNDSFTENDLDMAKSILETIEIIKKRMNSQDSLSGLDTSIPALNDFTSGWMQPDLIILAGRPGMGKSAVAIQTVLNLALRNIPAVFYSYEMPQSQVLLRSSANLTGINSKKMIKPKALSPVEFDNIENALKRIEDSPFYVYSTTMPLSKLISNIRYNAKKNGIKLAVIDYLQLVNNDMVPENATENIKVGGISKALKQLAIELKIPIIALSQLSRSVETRGGDKKPKLADLRDSGSIEQDADIVMFCWRPEYYNIEVQTSLGNCIGFMEIIIAKGRNIGITNIPTYYDVRINKIMDWGDQLFVNE